MNADTTLTTISDVLLVGVGGAALSAAIEIKTASPNSIVICASESDALSTHTAMAQGGMNAVLEENDQGDSWQDHFSDTIRSGGGLSDEEAVSVMCQNAEDAFNFLLGCGVEFDKDAKAGTASSRPYGGQVKSRAKYFQDRTGFAVQKALLNRARESGVEFLIQVMFYDAVRVKDGSLLCFFFDLLNCKIRVIKTKKLVFATGGFSSLYKTSTGNKDYAPVVHAFLMAHSAAIKDPEFVQFHPTGFYDDGTLVSEAATAEGGYLVNRNGERFMERYSPKFKDLATRDVVARAINQEILEGRGFVDEKGQEYIELHVAHLGKEKILTKLPLLYENAKNCHGIDITKDPVRVNVSAHYTMGGIDAEIGGKVKSDKKGVFENIYCIGEAACLSVHGANRLGCNSLLEIIVFGRICGQNIAKEIGGKELEITASDMKVVEKRTEGVICSVLNGAEIDDLRSIMQSNVNIIRREKDLLNAKKEIEKLYTSVRESSLPQYIKTISSICVANAIIECALDRKESRGSHYRRDFSSINNEKFLSHSLFKLSNSHSLDNIESYWFKEVGLLA